MEQAVTTEAQEINLVEIIIETINALCNNLFSSIDNTIFPLLDQMVFIKDDILETTYLEKILGNTADRGLLVLSNALLVSFVLYYCVKLMFSHYIGNETEPPYKFFLKSVIYAIVMNCSLFICSQLINLTHYISSFICDLGELIFGKELTFVNIINLLSSSLPEDFNMFSIDGLITGMLSFSSFALLITFALRYIMVKVLVLLSPFAFLCLINKSTEGFFRSWYKAFLSILFVQILVALILLLPYAIVQDGASSLFNKLLLLGSIYALLKSNQFIKEFIGGIGISTDFQAGLSGLRSIIGR
jgi:hypothetical protein